MIICSSLNESGTKYLSFLAFFFSVTICGEMRRVAATCGGLPHFPPASRFPLPASFLSARCDETRQALPQNLGFLPGASGLNAISFPHF